jgi:murein DD-endopeptidase MepM/ murein hydrolase activator NlpD
MRSSSPPSATAERKLAGVRLTPYSITTSAALLACAALVLAVVGAAFAQVPEPTGLDGAAALAHSGPVEQESTARQSLRDAQLNALPLALAALVHLDVTNQSFIKPVDARVSSHFGWRNVSVNGNRHHAGVDLAASWGTPVRAARAGRVERSGWWGTYGNAVALDHGDGSETRYAHLSSLAVGAGDVVRQGDVIGYVGSTGASTGPHLHFELRFDGRAVDPLGYLVDDATAAR